MIAPNNREPFTDPNSIVRVIWGSSDTILFVFAGAAAEFALSRAVDWLFFTGNLPADPIGRLFSTARFARDIVFTDQENAQRTLQRINAIHGAVEQKRAQQIPDWAQRDVLYMLIDYSERAYRLLHRPLTPAEQADLFDVFLRVGQGLQIPDLPATYAEWLADRQRHLDRNLCYSDYTAQLYRQYRRHLGMWRFRLLLHIQTLLVPGSVRQLLPLKPSSSLAYTVQIYPLVRRFGLRPLLQRILVPAKHLASVRQLEQSLNVAGT